VAVATVLAHLEDQGFATLAPGWRVAVAAVDRGYDGGAVALSLWIVQQLENSNHYNYHIEIFSPYLGVVCLTGILVVRVLK
jgi:hypothetical protein